ncbi:MAG: proton-conducting transporter membrane subunit, partial [Limisphaerales bacterium]
SSLEHIGLICAAIGLNAPLTIFGALLHMGYHALIKPVLFFAAGNIHQSCHTLHIPSIGPGLSDSLPVTVLCMGLAGTAAIGLPPFGLFFSEMTVLNGGFASGHPGVSLVALTALIASFCGILYQLSRILIGAPRMSRPRVRMVWDGVPAMGFMLVLLVALSLWLPAPLSRILEQAAAVIGGSR